MKILCICWYIVAGVAVAADAFGLHTNCNINSIMKDTSLPVLCEQTSQAQTSNNWLTLMSTAIMVWGNYFFNSKNCKNVTND